MITEYGLGRLYIPDERDANFPLSAALPSETQERTHRYWNNRGIWLNQGNFPHCVGFSWTHWLKDGPVTFDQPVDAAYASQLYRECQFVDQWAGENYDGTSVRAGAKILQDRGLISSYRWATTIDEVVHCLLHVGPMVVGTTWYASMFHPNSKGVIEIFGKAEGGHAYKLDGINTKSGLIRIKNSWGRGWGKNGHAYIHVNDFSRLLQEYGEACLAVEV